MLNNIIGKKCAFEVKVTSFNRDGRAGYTIGCLMELPGSSSGIKGGRSTDDEGPSKKIRLDWNKCQWTTMINNKIKGLQFHVKVYFKTMCVFPFLGPEPTRTYKYHSWVLEKYYIAISSLTLLNAMCLLCRVDYSAEYWLSVLMVKY